MRTYIYFLSLIVVWPFISGKCPDARIANGVFRKISRGRKIMFRCRPNFLLYGKRTAYCIVRKWSHPPPVCVASGCPDVEPPANGNMTVSYNGAVLNFSCFSGHHTNDDMTILCLGTKWNASPPTCVANREITECDFEKNMCGWQQDESDDFDWSWKKGRTTTPFTGPSWDHTHGKERMIGHYIYIETSDTIKEKDRAALLSPTYGADQSNTCFSFWYHMYGNSIGNLTVSTGLADNQEVLFSETGDHNNTWHKGEIFIKEMETPFQIVISASKGKNWLGDIAIDDVKLGNCSDGFIWTDMPAAVSTVISKIQPVSSDFTVEFIASTKTEGTSFTTSLDSNLQTTLQQELIVTKTSKIVNDFTYATKIDKKYIVTQQWMLVTEPVSNTISEQSAKMGQRSSESTGVPPLTIYLGVGIPITLIAIVLVIVAVYCRRRNSAANNKGYQGEIEAIFKQRNCTLLVFEE